MVLAPEGYSVAGPAGAYIFHALSASAELRDAAVDSPEPDDIRQLVLDTLAANGASASLVTAMTEALDDAAWPGQVFVTVLARDGNGTAAPDLIAAVDAKLNGQAIRPLTDAVTVQSAEIVPYGIEATLTFFPGPDRAVVLAEAQARLARYRADREKLGLDVVRAGIIAALCPDGVQNVELTAPAADIPITRRQASFCTGVTIVDGGTGE